MGSGLKYGQAIGVKDYGAFTAMKQQQDQISYGLSAGRTGLPSRKAGTDGESRG